MYKILINGRYYEAKTLKKNLSVCNENLQHRQNSVETTLNADENLLGFLANLQNESIPAKVYKDNQLEFTGNINTEISWVEHGRPLPVEEVKLTINDNTHLLEKSLSEQVFKDKTFREIVDSLVSSVGLNIGMSAPDIIIIPLLVIEEGKNLRTFLDEFSFQYGYSFHFNAYGEIEFFDYKVPELTEVLETIGPEKIIEGMTISRNSKNYSGVRIRSANIIKKDNELVYFYVAGWAGEEQNYAPQPTIIQPGVYFPFESAPQIEADSGKVYQEYENGYAESFHKYNGEISYRRNTKAQLIYTENAQVVTDWEGSLTINRTDFSFKKAAVRLYNSGASDASLNSLSIRATAYYSGEETEMRMGSPDNTYELDAVYLTSSNIAFSTSKSLYQYFVTGKYKIQFSSEISYLPGTFVQIDTDFSGFTVKTLIVSQELDAETGIFAYTAMAAGEASLDVHKARKAFNTDTAQGPAGAKGEKGDTGGSGFNISLDRPTILYQSDSKGYIHYQEDVSNVIIVQDGRELPFRFGHISSPVGMNIHTENNSVNVIAEEGVSLPVTGVVDIPVIYCPIDREDPYADENGEVYADEDNEIFVDYEYSSASQEYVLKISYAKNRQGGQGVGVYSDINSILYLSDPEGNIAPQVDRILITMIQDGCLLPFVYKNIEIPPGMEKENSGNEVTLYAKEGSELPDSGCVNINIAYTPVADSVEFADENEEIYADENGECYGDYIYTGEEVPFTLTVAFAKSIKGRRAPQYKGPLPEPPLDLRTYTTGDYYLNTSDGFFYEYESDTGRWKEIPYSDPRISLGMFDMVSIAESSTNNQLITAVNIWVKNLTASHILADGIFANEVIVKNGGCLRSESYEVGAKGYKLDDKKLTAENGVFHGEIDATSFNICIKEGDVWLGDVTEYWDKSGNVTARKSNYYKNCGYCRFNAKLKYHAYHGNETGNNYEVMVRSTLNPSAFSWQILYSKVFHDTKDDALIDLGVIQILPGDELMVTITSNFSQNTDSFNKFVELSLYASASNPVYNAICNIDKEVFFWR